MKFKNLRHPVRAGKAGIVVLPPPKKVKREKEAELLSTVVPSASSIAEYEQHVNFLQRSYHSKKWSVQHGYSARTNSKTAQELGSN